MMTFIDSLKRIVYDAHATGGTVIERSTVDSTLLQKLREHAVQQLAAGTQTKYLLLEWFSEGYLDEYVRVCVVYLRKLGITETSRVFQLIASVINVTLSGGSSKSRGEKDFESNLIDSLIEAWADGGDEQTQKYTFAETRLLISWDYIRSRWKVTGLGRLFLELSPVQATILLLSIDAMFSTGVRDFQHFNIATLKEIYKPQPDSDTWVDLMPLQRFYLLRLGILEDDLYESERIGLTPVGRMVLRRVVSTDNPFRDVARTLIETEELGDIYRGSVSEIADLLILINESELIDTANRNSIKTGLELYQANKYLDSLRILYPSIEAIINVMLIKSSERPEQFSGLSRKAQRLEELGVIPSDISSAVEIFTSRNKILHGNFSPSDAEYVFPICLLAFRYLRRLISEYNAKA